MHLHRITIFIYLLLPNLIIYASEDLVINEVMASNITAQINPNYSGFDDWIELHNKGTKTISIQGIFITDDLSDPFKWQLNMEVTLNPNSYYIIWADGKDFENHTSFKLSGNGEQIGLYHQDGRVIDTVTFGAQRNDISFGRYPDGGEQWHYFASPSFQVPNSIPGLISNEQAANPEYSTKGGLYSGPQSISLSSVPGTVIRYTLDGSTPTPDNEEYIDPIIISETTVVRARGFKENFLPSYVETSSYLINEPSTFPVISLSTPPEYLFDEEIGITVGICVSDKHGEPGGEPPFDPNANFWHKWERPVHIEYYSREGIEGFAQDAGIAIFGGFLGRQIRQKAFTLYARNSYGDSDFDFPLFPTKPINSYRRFILRASSNDFNRTFFRDAMMQTLVIGQMDIDYQAYQPVNVYINGKYWGLYNMREKTNQFYAEHNYDLDSDSIDLVEGISHTAHGDGGSYHALLEFVSNNDMSIQSNYEYVKTQMDVAEFMNYFITEIYICNHDWLYQNIKCWRDHGTGGKWRWLLYDLDWGFSGELVWKTEDYMDNTFQWIQAQGEASLLYQKLLENEEFKFEFVQRFATHLNLTFYPDRVLQTIDIMADRISPEIPRQIERWEALRSIEYWNEQLEILNSFAINRSGFIEEYLEGTYMLDGKSQIVFEVSNPESGWISVFDTPVPVPSFSGTWYEGLPVLIEAHAKPGWKFSEWSGGIQSPEAAQTISIFGNAVIQAHFESYELPSLLVSEIHYNPSSDLQGKDADFEFLEIFNYEKEQVDLSGYKFTDGIEFTFPEGSYINPGEFLLLAGNAQKFSDSGAQCFQVTDGRLDNAGEILTFCNRENEIIDQVHFDDHYPWPREPDGNGPTLELRAPSLDNALASSWRASEQTGGTPGFGHYTNVDEADPIPNNDLHVQIAPNPFQYTTTVSYSLKEEGLVSIDIINLNGQEVDNLLVKRQIPGNYQVAWAPQNLAAGIYLVKVLYDGDIQIRKVLYFGHD